MRTVDALEGRRGSGLKDLADGADVLVTSYTLFRLEAEQYGELDWGGMILDEAQAIKNRQGKTYQAVRDLRAPFRLAITGTPFENRLMELYSLLSVVAPGLYPTAKAFTEQVSRPVEKEGDEVALARLRRRLKPFLLRRTNDIVAADLPPKQEQVLDVALGERHRAIYDTHLQRERQSVLGSSRTSTATRWRSSDRADQIGERVPHGCVGHHRGQSDGTQGPQGGTVRAGGRWAGRRYQRALR